MTRLPLPKWAPGYEVIIMRRTMQEILESADDLATRFEAYEPKQEDERGLAVVSAPRRSAVEGSVSEQPIRNAGQASSTSHDG
jgi:hypothetical protein